MASLEFANQLAGFAALINGLILWPMMRAIQAAVVVIRQDLKTLMKDDK